MESGHIIPDIHEHNVNKNNGCHPAVRIKMAAMNRHCGVQCWHLAEVPKNGGRKVSSSLANYLSNEYS